MLPAHHLKKTALTYAGLTIASIMVLTMLLTSKPNTNLISKGFNQDHSITAVHSFIGNCAFTYNDCDQKPHLTNTPLDVIGKSFDLNPQLITVLIKLQYSVETSDQSTATVVAQNLKSVYKTYHELGIPMVVDHPTLGIYKLNNLNRASYVVFRYLIDQINSPEKIKDIIASPNALDGQTQGFEETYVSLFNQSPL